MIQLFKSLSLTSRIGVIAGLFLVLVTVTPIFADVPVPTVPKANGKQCVEEPGFMRRNHMDILKHQRDETMHNGIRTKKYSLQNCLTCHAVKDKKQNFVTAKDERHFCRSCHTYAAVKIDCFECHNSTPMDKSSTQKKHSGI